MKEEINLGRIVRLLELAAYKIWDACLVGNQCEKTREMFEDMKNPKPGDLVIEKSTLYAGKMRGTDGKMESCGICGIGYLVKIERESIWTEEQVKINGWKLENDGPIPTEKVIYLKLFDGREIRWTNADVLKIPISIQL